MSRDEGLGLDLPLSLGRAERELQQRDWLLRVAQAISQPLELRVVLERVVRAAVTMTAGHAGAIGLRQPDGELRMVASVQMDARFEAYLARHGIAGHEDRPAGPDASPSDMGPGSPDPGEAVRGETWGARPAPLVHPERPHQAFAAGSGIALEALGGGLEEGQQVLTLPLEIGAEAIGRIFVFRSTGAAAFTPLDASLLETFADQAAVAIQNADTHERLLARERGLASIVEHSPAGVLLLDRDGRLLSHNTAALGLLGIGAADAEGRTAAELVDLSDAQDRPLRLPDPGAAGARSVQGRLRRADGSDGPWVQLTASSLPEPRPGQGGGQVIDIVDLSGYKEAEDAKRAFLAGLSHELKTPLALIRGYAEGLRYPQLRGDDQLFGEAVGVILDETDHLTRLVDQLLSAARLDAGALRLDLHTLDLGRELPRWLEPFRGAHAERPWPLDLSPGPPVVADPLRLREVLENLWSNALKYSPPGAEVRTALRPSGGGVAIDVSDKGAGIEVGQRERVFQRFTRTRETGDGAGLGLYMARAIAEAHGGRLELLEPAGEGSTFRLWLPGARAT